jgi:hypothetical protein
VENFRSKGTMCEDWTSFDFLGVRSLAYLLISLNKTKEKYVLKKNNTSLNNKSKPQNGSSWGKKINKTY